MQRALILGRVEVRADAVAGRRNHRTSLSKMLHEYLVVGRKTPTARDPAPTVYKMRLFATDAPKARSRFWYFLSKLKRVKKANGEIVAVHEIFEKNPNTVKNWGVWLRYDSRSGTHNMYKEYRDTHLTGAIEQMYTEMAGRHRARKSCIQIMRTEAIPASACKRPNTQQFHDSKIKFPLPSNCLPRPSHKSYKTTFKANRPVNLH